MTKNKTVDIESLHAVLEWALYYNQEEIVEVTLPVVQKAEQACRIPLEKRIALYLLKESAENLKLGSSATIDTLLNELFELEPDFQSDESTSENWAYWVREVIFVGGLNVLYEKLNVNNGDSPVVFNSSKDVQNAFPSNFNAAQYKKQIEAYFTAHRDHYFKDGENTSSSEGKDLYQNHINTLTTSLFNKGREKGAKTAVSMTKIFTLFQDHSWQHKKQAFFEFVEELGETITPVPPKLCLVETLDVKKRHSGHKQGEEILKNISEADWSDSRAKAQGPYADHANLPDSSFSSPQKSHQVNEVHKPKRVNRVAEITSIQAKYQALDPLPEILAHSESTKLFASKAATVEKQAVTSSHAGMDNEVSGTPNRKRKFSSPDRQSEPKTDRQKAIVSFNQQKVVQSARNQNNEDDSDSENEEKDRRAVANDESIEDVESDESELGLRQAVGGLQALSDSVQRKAKKPRKSIASQLGSPLGGEGNRTGGQRVRRRWTTEEQIAFEAGIARHGAGNWHMIRDDPELRPALKDRTNVNLKDRFRNMVKNGWRPGDDTFKF